VDHLRTTEVRLIRHNPNRTHRHLREVDTKGMSLTGITNRVSANGKLRSEEFLSTEGKGENSTPRSLRQEIFYR
jgi:hypothetical protein